MPTTGIELATGVVKGAVPSSGSTIFGIPTWAIIAGGAVLAYFLFIRK